MYRYVHTNTSIYQYIDASVFNNIPCIEALHMHCNTSTHHGIVSSLCSLLIKCVNKYSFQISNTQSM